MRHPLILLSVLCAVAWASLSFTPCARAESDPSEIFLNAYMSVQQAEKLEGNGNYQAALTKYRYAGSLLDQLHERNPQWQALVVAYRKKKTAEAIAKLERWIAAEQPASTAIPDAPAPTPGGGLDPGLLPGVSDLPENPLPTSAESASTGGDTAAPADLVEKAAQKVREEMAELRRQLKLSQQQLEDTRTEKAALASQLEEAVERAKQSAPTEAPHETPDATAQGEGTPTEPPEAIQQLREELEKAKAAAAEAKSQLEKAKASEKELNAQLAQARRELETGGPVASANAKEEIAKIQEALADARADREVAEEQGEIMARKMADLAKRPDLSGKLADAERKAKSLTAENEKITQKLTEAREKIETLESTGKELTKERDTERQKNVKLAGELADAQKEAEKKEKELAEAERKLIATAKERDTALAKLEKASHAEGDLKKLLAERDALATKLDEAQKTITSLQGSAPEKEKEIAGLKEQLAGVQQQLTAAKEENEKSGEAIKNLQAQLEATKTATPGSGAEPADPEEQQKLSQENELLRGIVLRELKNQARREQARKLIVSELDRLQVRSKALNEQVTLLGQPAVELTQEERGLFKAPQLEIVDNETNAMAISIVAPQIHPEGGDAANPTANPAAALPLPEAKTGEAPLVETAAANPADTVGTSNTADLQPDLPEALQPLAREAKEKFDQGHYAEAEQSYEKLAAKAPSNLYVLSNLGAARYQAGKLKQAEETFRKVIAIAPEDASSYTTLGIVYYKQGKYDDAVTSLTRSLAINPKNPTAHNYLGVTAAQKGWKKAAQKEIETAIQINPSYADAHFNLAVVLATAQPPDKENALKHYKKAVSLGSAPDKTLEEMLR